MSDHDVEEIKIPTMGSADQHGQIMFALGQIIGTQKGIMARQDITNGKVLKNTNDIDLLKVAQANAAGQDSGVSKTWTAIFTVVGLLVGALGVYVALHH